VIVSIVNVLLKLFAPNELVQINTINAISQVANLAAQKKIGSNFDISTAIYGSHLYKNILPKMAY
jgi:phosphomevalonate kinase